MQKEITIKLGTLVFLPAREHPELIAPAVASAIRELPGGGEVKVAVPGSFFASLPNASVVENLAVSRKPEGQP